LIGSLLGKFFLLDLLFTGVRISQNHNNTENERGSEPDREMAMAGKKEKVVGILGGMGPAATLDLISKILKHTPATLEQDHLRILVDINPKVPDRVAAILEGKKEILPVLTGMAQGLERMGADLLAIACNNAHYYWEAVRESVKIPVLHMIRETASALSQKIPSPSRVGLLATSAMIQIGLYERILKEAGIATVVPTQLMQERITEVILGVKGKVDPQELKRFLDEPIAEMAARGINDIVIGCTEIPIVLPFSNIHGIRFWDATEILAMAILRDAFPPKD
jgi:aspartate racemase